MYAMSDWKDEERAYELEMEAAQDEAHEIMRSEILEKESDEAIRYALDKLNLADVDDDARQLLATHLKTYFDHIAAGNDAPNSSLQITEEEWDEIQEQESFGIDDRLEVDALFAQNEYMEALQIANQTQDADRWKEAQRLQVEAEKRLNEWGRRRTRRENNKRLRAAIAETVKMRGWSREEFASRADVSLSTVRNLLVSTDPDRKWRPAIQRSIEDALGWPRGAFNAMLETGELPSQPADNDLVGVRLDPAIRDSLESIALSEGRTINAVVKDAIRVYMKVYGPSE